MPNTLDLIMTPFVVMLVTFLVVILGIGPVMHMVELKLVAIVEFSVLVVVMCFVLTCLFGIPKEVMEPDEDIAEVVHGSEVVESVPAGISCQAGTVYAPVSSKVIPSETIPDETFAAGVLGRGVGIEPTEGRVVAPFDGVISFTTDTRHAVGISSLDGIELLIHVRVDTVEMKGDGFRCFVKEGQQVRVGYWIRLLLFREVCFLEKCAFYKAGRNCLSIKAE